MNRILIILAWFCLTTIGFFACFFLVNFASLLNG